MSLATHCIPYDEECSICNPPRSSSPPPDIEIVHAEGVPDLIIRTVRASSPPPPSPTQESGKKIWVHCPNCKTGFINTLFEPATPSSPETPAELTEALDAALKLARDFEWAEHYASLDEGRSIAAKLNSARSALLAIYTRQREEIDRWEASALTNLANYKTANDYADSLSSQLERLTEVRDDLLGVIDGQNVTIDRYSRDVERLKASQLTPEEAGIVIDNLRNAYINPTPELGQAITKLAALRLRSLSEEKATDA